MTLLERVLGQYVEGLDRASLKVAVWAGNVTLSDLKLRSEAFYALGLPVNVTAGCVQSVQVTIPWSKLGSSPVIISLEGVYLVAGPLAESNWDEAAQRAWAWARKQGHLDRLEQAAELSSLQALSAGKAADGETPESHEPATTDGQPRKQHDAVGLLGKVLGNLQLSIRNLHLRYEDRTQCPSAPFAIGVTLAELSAFTTDADGNRRFVIDAAVQRKCAIPQWIAAASAQRSAHTGLPVGEYGGAVTVWCAVAMWPVRTPRTMRTRTHPRAAGCETESATPAGAVPATPAGAVRHACWRCSAGGWSSPISRSITTVTAARR